MKVNKIIERAEKFRLLGRFDEKSAISFVNDAIFDVVQRQSIEISHTVNDYTNGEIELPGSVVKVQSVHLDVDPESLDRFFADSTQSGNVKLYIIRDGIREEIKESHNVQFNVSINYIGCIPVETRDDDIELPPHYESSLVYFVRAKMLEETGMMEESQYFMSQFASDMIRKSSANRDIVSIPSKYSLL